LYNHAEFSCLFIKCNYYFQDFVKNIWISNLQKLNGHPDSSSSSSEAESSSESDSTEVQDGNFVGTFNSDENSAASLNKDEQAVRAVINKGISVEALNNDENPRASLNKDETPVGALNNDENSLWVLRSDANNPVEAASFLGCETNQRRGPWIDFEAVNFFVRSSVEQDDDDDDEAGSSNQLHEGLDVERNVVHRQIPGNCLKQDNENFKFYFFIVYSFTFLQFFSVC